jgi:hypothetical protein
MSMLSQALPTYREDASMDSAQPPGTDPRGDCIVAQAQLRHLGSRDNTVLASGQGGQPPIDPNFSTLLGHHPRKTENLGSHPLIARRRRFDPSRRG